MRPAGLIVLAALTACGRNHDRADSGTNGPGGTGGAGGLGAGGAAGTGGGAAGAGGSAGGSGSGAGGTAGTAGSGDCLDLSQAPVGRYDFRVVGTGFDAYDGQTVRAVVVVNSGLANHGVGQTTIRNGTFEIVLPKTNEPYTGYGVYIDRGGDDACTVNVDPFFQMVSGGVYQDVNWEINPQTTFLAGLPPCNIDGFFDLTQPLPCSPGSTTGDDAGFPDASDAGADGGGPTMAACEGVDAGSAASASYVDLNISASGFSEHEGQTVFLVTRANGVGVIGAASATVTGGAFSFHFPKGYKRATDQEIIWLLDADGDGVCDDAAGDHTGFSLVSATDPPGAEPVAVSISDNHLRMTSSGANLCNSVLPFGDMLDMNVTGTGFDGHEGRTVHLLGRTFYNGAIFASGDAIVAGGGFTLPFKRGFQRFTYEEIFFFVDVDGDGRCTPGTDHPGYTTTAGFNPTQNVPIDVPVMDNHMAQSARGADVCAVMNGCQLAP
jgi:hypothetical protein